MIDCVQKKKENLKTQRNQIKAKIKQNEVIVDEIRLSQ